MASVQSTRSGRGRGRRGLAEINMVPFIDVMLVLLIIFMVTAPLITPSTIELPSVGKASKQPDVVISVVIKADESLQMKVGTNEQVVPTVNALVAAVQGAMQGKSDIDKEQTAVVISADKSVKYDNVIKVMDGLQRAGIKRLGLSVQLSGQSN